MRCYICDWSPTSGSTYRSGLVINDSDIAPISLSNNHLFQDASGKHVCAQCESSIYDPLDITESPEHEELEEVIP